MDRVEKFFRDFEAKHGPYECEGQVSIFDIFGEAKAGQGDEQKEDCYER